ncbi:MAG: Fic family protein [Syntrophobacteraceae bacterium]|jgi:Fic family protein
MNVYIYDKPDWPKFRWNRERLDVRLAAARYNQGRLIGRMKEIGFSFRCQATLHTLTLDVLKSSEIEGEILDKEQVRSSIARRLGMNIGAMTPVSRDIEGVVEMMLDATQNYGNRLTLERLFAWHASLFPTGHSGVRKIKVAAWRDDAKGPMQVVSGPIGREHVHFQAPPADRLEKEMAAFLDWFNGDDGTDLVLRACIAHLWFVTIHPFEDGNGRIARAIADMTLARSEQSAQRFYSMSAQIRQERDAYYGGLEAAQKGTLDITDRLEWFLDCLGRALDAVEGTLSAVFKKARFWKSCAALQLNERQRLILNKLMDGFKGKLTSSKWAALAKCSQDTALRDIQYLVERGILTKDPGGGRSTSYSLAEID